jgi:hypothetical protein
MARVKNTISGKIENVVYYTVGDKQFVRIKARRVKQSKATKVRSHNFGVASAAGRVLRAQLKQAILVPKDRSMQIRFSGAIAKWLQRYAVAEIPSAEKLPFIHDFTFSKEKGMDVRCRIPMLVEQGSDELITIAVPAFIPTRDISAPARTVAIKLTLSVAGVNLDKGLSTGSETIGLHLDHNNEMVAAQTLNFHVPVLPGTLLVTVGSMEYILNDGDVCSKEAFMPCSVMDARYVG